ncbi:MAG: hypothetical protein WBB84_01980, partial [Candidatus Omnitrophota bacterium]
MFKFITNLLRKIFGTQNERELNRLQPIVDKINALDAGISGLSDEELKKKAECFKETLRRAMEEKMPEIEK